MRSFLVYGLSDPRDGQLRYVGKTIRGLSRRLRTHLYPRFLREKSHKNHWLRALVALGLKPEIEVLEECGSWETMNEAERFHIAYWRYIGAALTNSTAGGEEGFGRGRTHTKDARRKIGEGNRGKKRGADHGVRTSRARGGRPIVDQFERRYETMAEAARVLGLRRDSVRKVLIGAYRQTEGYTFRYL